MAKQTEFMASTLAATRGRRNRFAEIEYADNIGATLRRLAMCLSREKGLTAALFAVIALGTACGVWAPNLQSDAIDIIGGVRQGAFGQTLALMLALYVLYSASQLAQGLLSARLSQRVVGRLRAALFGKTVELPVDYLDEHAHGDVMSRMTNDVENVSLTISQSLPSLFSGVLTVVGSAVAMFALCWQLALVCCACALLTALATKVLSKRVRAYSRQQQAYLGMLNATAEEFVSGYRTVVAYNRQDATVRDFCATSDKLTKAGIRMGCFSGVMGPISNAVGNLSFVAVAACGGYFAVQGTISIGVISAFIVYAKLFSKPINELAHVYCQLQTAIAGAERVFALMDEDSESDEGEPLECPAGASIRFERVTFSYDGCRRVLEGFDVQIPAGKKVALVGATGSGKTTAVSLLMRFYDPDSGRITINGTDIRTVARSSLRKHIGIVLQDTALFTGTVRENMAFACENADDERIEAALEAACCKEVVDSLPHGLDTVLSGGGEGLSQGQRQLLAIARAFVADPAILVLDEATSNVDTRTEKAIQEAMHRLMENRTSIVVAHRLSTVRDADLIVVLDRGRIVERGTHEQLLAAGGVYCSLCRAQQEGFLT